MKKNAHKKDSNNPEPVLESFFIKMPEVPQISSAEAERTEQHLLACLKTQGPRAETLKPLATFYSRIAQPDRAYQYLKLWMKYTQDVEELAECLLMCGQLAEQGNQPEPAIAFYREGLKQKPKQPRTNYFLHNNLAYCLNLQGAYQEAIKHCEAALGFDPTRSHVYKNYGISLKSLGQYPEAARIWIKAIHVDASDSRALELLEELLQQHYDEIKNVLPDLEAQMDACRKASAAAKTGRFADWARGLTLN